VKLTFEFLVEFVNRVNQDEFENPDPYIPSLSDTTRRRNNRTDPRKWDALLDGFMDELDGKPDGIPPELSWPSRELGWLWDLHFYVDLVRLRKNIEKGTAFGKGILLIPDSPRMLRGNPSQEELDARAQKALESILVSDWEFLFRYKGSVWELGSPGKRIEMPDLKGLHNIQYLLKHPMEKIDSLELRKLSDEAPPIDANTEGVPEEYEAMTADQLEVEGMSTRDSLDEAIHPADDPHLKKTYELIVKERKEIREKIADLRKTLPYEEGEKLEEKCKEIEKLEEEEDKLTKYFSRTHGLGGKPRSTDEQELARKAVKKRIGRAIDLIRSKHPPLGEHLRLTIKTGRQCSHAPGPDNPIQWRF